MTFRPPDFLCGSAAWRKTSLATPCYPEASTIQGDLCFMAKSCEVCGRGPQFGNRISHAHNVTKRRWNINLKEVHALINGAGRRIRVCTSCIKSGKVLKVA
jgi:large subunit ribosomal protein L28